MLRWYLNTEAWTPSSDEFEFLLNLINEEDQRQVRKFIHEADQKRALASRLLQRACVRLICKCSDSGVQIMRTKGGKPFTLNQKPKAAPNFNFNVSHEGDYTALAAEPYCLCGIDVAAPLRARRPSGKQSLHQIINTMKGQFHTLEWSCIQSYAQREDMMEDCFLRHWSLKEAYVKARGDGLGFEPLSRAAFTFEDDDSILARYATVAVDGVMLNGWRFEIQRLGDKHWVTVARGPPQDIVDAYGVFKSTFGQKHCDASAMQEHLHDTPPHFTEMNVCDLIPDDTLSAYDAVHHKGKL
ncbi:hypothetical protein CEUSTIGMA_g2950.t1 [Chlamydomonas eustigma]|uniref:holo-[acyl-carrier-protein] synthase n=1 Tax=Chlamydomonas eustigma TaxID=1157962 RepID=A0A250WXE3_9CHLO|nr:hypothetical protein CEUSTIGMA_g2950.t1 [Chlamydomonas eustigma]|eukprot:GAX75507.1 hypothetical protein CEUSTIGMA_g2950.t1 [Chlamydomonas eustigma]